MALSHRQRVPRLLIRSVASDEEISTAVFDEGVSTPGGWLDQALENGYEAIPLGPEIVRKLEQMGYRRTVLPKSRYRQLAEDALTIDYSGWALVTHRWLPEKVAYAAVQTIDEKQKLIPVDDESPIDMNTLCNGSEKCPLAAGEGYVLVSWSMSPPANWDALTRAELAVATALIEGASNREIAAARGSSVRTVANQVASIFRKLGVRSRGELVTTGARAV